MLWQVSARLNASVGTLLLPFNMRLSKWETKPDVGKAFGPCLWSDSSSGGEESSNYINKQKANHSGYPYVEVLSKRLLTSGTSRSPELRVGSGSWVVELQVPLARSSSGVPSLM